MKRPTRETCRALADAIDAYIAKADNPLTELLKRAGYVKVPETMEAVRALEEKLAKVFGSHTNSVLERIKEIQQTGTLDIYGVMNSLLEREPDATRTSAGGFALALNNAFREAFTDLMPKLVRAYSAKIDDKVAVKSITQRTTDFFNGWSAQLATLMKLNSDADIKKIIDKGLRDGMSVPDVARRIREQGIRWQSWRARSVALTEMLRAHSYAQLDAYTQNPAVTGKRWLHTGGRYNDPRENHVRMSGTVVPVEQAFTLAGADGSTYYPMCPRDASLPASESVNCHCLIQPVVDENILGMPLEERQRLTDQAREDDNYAWRDELDLRKRIEALRYRGEDTAPADADLKNLLARRLARFAGPKLTDEQVRGLADRFDEGTPMARKVYDKYVPQGSGIVNEKSDGTACFRPLENGVFMDIARDAYSENGAWSTYFHEHGHYVDFNAGTTIRGHIAYLSDTDQALIDALKADVKKMEQDTKKQKGFRRVADARDAIGQQLLDEGDESAGIQDIFGGTIGRRYGWRLWGHDASYWRQGRDRKLAHEAFANMFEAQYSPRKRELMRKYLPTSWERFCQIMELLADG